MGRIGVLFHTVHSIRGAEAFRVSVNGGDITEVLGVLPVVVGSSSEAVLTQEDKPATVA